MACPVPPEIKRRYFTRWEKALYNSATTKVSKIAPSIGWRRISEVLFVNLKVVVSI
jgi:hypothetical protein